MMNNSGGKGGASRPLSIPLDEFGDKFTGIFGERKKTNGGWTPPPLYKPEQSLKTNVHVPVNVELPSGTTVQLKTPDVAEIKAALDKGDVKTLVTVDSMAEHTDKAAY
jgi:hypothetical protein